MRHILGYVPILFELAIATALGIFGVLLAATLLVGCAHDKPRVGDGEALVCYGAVAPDGTPVMVCTPYTSEAQGGSREAL